MTDNFNHTNSIVWDENNQPYSTRFNDIYFSKNNGLNETNYVFIKQNQLENRFNQLANNQHFTIAETGFGTGLNFLATLKVWQQRKNY